MSVEQCAFRQWQKRPPGTISCSFETRIPTLHAADLFGKSAFVGVPL